MKRLQQNWQIMGDALQLGASIVIAIFLGAAIGWVIDSYCGTLPIFSIIFFFLGIGAAVRNVWIEVRKQVRQDKGEKPR